MKSLRFCTWVALFGLALSSPSCRFAPSFSSKEISEEPGKKAEFLAKVLEQEKAFICGIGFDKDTGLTRTSITLNAKTGMPEDTGIQGTQDDEAIHISILTKCLQDGCMGLSSVTEAIDTLKLKLNNLSGDLSANLIIALGKLSDVLVSKYHQSELLNQVALLIKLGGRTEFEPKNFL